MATKVFYHLLSAAQKSMAPWREVITAGSTTTVTLGNMYDAPDDDYFNGGVVFILTGTHAEKVMTITDWVQSTKVLTFSPALGSAPSAGDEVVFFPMNYKIGDLYRALNEVLAEMPPVDKFYEDASFVTVANQAEYDLPTAGWEITSVEIATTGTAPYGYVESGHWNVIDDQVVFIPLAIPAENGYRIRLRYRSYPVAVDDYDDTVSEWYDTDWVGWWCAEKMIHWRMRRLHGQDPFLAQDHAHAQQMRQMAEVKHQGKIPRRRIVEKASPWAAVGS